MCAANVNGCYYKTHNKVYSQESSLSRGSFGNVLVHFTTTFVKVNTDDLRFAFGYPHILCTTQNAFQVFHEHVFRHQFE